jgi:hypothetical protein
VLHEIGGQIEYGETTTVSKPIAIFGAIGELPRIRAAGANPALTVTADGVLIFVGVQVQSGQSTGITIEGGSAWIESSRIVNNTGGGIVVNGGGTLVLTNSFVGGSADSPALSVSDGTFELRYATLGLPAVLGGAALDCADGSLSSVRNSLITSTHADPEVDCPNLTITGSALEMSQGDNVALGNLVVGWFDGYLAGDFHLSGTHPAAINTAATWQTGDPTIDIDGDARPDSNGAADVAGADVP